MQITFSQVKKCRFDLAEEKNLFILVGSSEAKKTWTGDRAARSKESECWCVCVRTGVQADTTGVVMVTNYMFIYITDRFQ